MTNPTFSKSTLEALTNRELAGMLSRLPGTPSAGKLKKLPKAKLVEALLSIQPQEPQVTTETNDDFDLPASTPTSEWQEDELTYLEQQKRLGEQVSSVPAGDEFAEAQERVQKLVAGEDLPMPSGAYVDRPYLDQGEPEAPKSDRAPRVMSDDPVSEAFRRLRSLKSADGRKHGSAKGAAKAVEEITDWLAGEGGQKYATFTFTLGGRGADRTVLYVAVTGSGDGGVQQVGQVEDVLEASGVRWTRIQGSMNASGTLYGLQLVGQEA